MEFMVFKKCMEYLIARDLIMTTFVSDRHTAIASHMSTVLKNIIHYFDIWHLKKSKHQVFYCAVFKHVMHVFLCGAFSRVFLEAHANERQAFFILYEAKMLGVSCSCDLIFICF